VRGLKLPERVLKSLVGISSSVYEDIKRGFEELAAITKRTEDVAMNLDKLLAAGEGGNPHVLRPSQKHTFLSRAGKV